jgi:hypothetical protein
MFRLSFDPELLDIQNSELVFGTIHHPALLGPPIHKQSLRSYRKFVDDLWLQEPWVVCPSVSSMQEQYENASFHGYAYQITFFAVAIVLCPGGESFLGALLNLLFLRLAYHASQ